MLYWDINSKKLFQKQENYALLENICYWGDTNFGLSNYLINMICICQISFKSLSTNETLPCF